MSEGSWRATCSIAGEEVGATDSLIDGVDKETATDVLLRHFRYNVEDLGRACPGQHTVTDGFLQI